MITKTDPDMLPEEAPPSSPIPWSTKYLGNGDTEIYDAKGNLLYLVYAWNQKDFFILKDKLSKVNGVPTTPSTEKE